MKYTEQKKKIVISSFVIFSILFFIFYRVRYLIPGIAEHVGSCVLYPFLKMNYYCIEPIKKKCIESKNIEFLNQYIVDLERHNEALRAENIVLKASQSFIDDIQEVLEFKKRYDASSMHTVHILARHCSSDNHFIYVDAGVLSGITIDMIALFNHMIVGRVIEVYPWYSKVQLVTDPACSISVYDMQTGARGIYRGCGNDHGYMTRVNHLENVCVGDEVFSSGDGFLFPRGYLVGTVDSYEPNGLYHTIRITHALNINSIQYCVLIGRSR